MHKRVLYTDSRLELLRQLREDKLLSLYVFLCTAKESKPDSHFIRSDFYNIGYSKSTVRLRLRQLKENGWAFETKNNKIILLSYKKIAASYGVAMDKHKRKRYYGDSLKELLARASSVFVIHNIHLQQKHLLNGEKARYKPTFAQCYTQGVCLSVRWMRDVLGFKTATSGTNYLKYMQEELCVIERRKPNDEYLGNVKNVGIEVLKNIENCYLSQKGGIFKRKCCLIKTV
jgi:hypothetical protein